MSRRSLAVLALRSEECNELQKQAKNNDAALERKFSLVGMPATDAKLGDNDEKEASSYRESK
jgi:hypothetical protein